MGLPGVSVVENLLANSGDTKDAGSSPGSGRTPGEGNGNPPQYSSLGNSQTEEPGRLESVASQELGMI